MFCFVTVFTAFFVLPFSSINSNCHLNPYSFNQIYNQILMDGNVLFMPRARKIQNGNNDNADGY